MSGKRASDDAVVSVENEALRITVRRDSGEYEILHRPTGRTWMGPSGRLCSLRLIPEDGRAKSGYETDRVNLVAKEFEQIAAGQSSIKAVYVPERRAVRDTTLRLEFSLTLLGTDCVELGYSVLAEDPSWSIHSVRIVDDALAIADAGDYAIIPVYQGEAIPVGSRFSYQPEDRKPTVLTSDVVGTYPGMSIWNMALFALVKGNSTALVTWDDPSAEPGLSGRDDGDGGPEITSTVILHCRANAVRVHFLEGAGYVETANYYREIAKGRGFFVPLEERMKERPMLEKNIGALRFTVAPKWAREKGSGWAPFLADGESRVDYSFDEIAEVAEHLKVDLGIEKALVLVKAWSRRGYDMDYPDVLPAAPECGGNDGLARASERVQGLGWLFGIHDNSVILFKSAPSTDPADALMRDDGTPVEGGVGAMDWQMYHCCPACMLKYVGKNYPRFRELFQLNYIYADQIAAMPVAECFSPRHPLSHQEVIETYRELLEFMRSQIPMVSSEIADEWAVPLFDTMGIAVGKVHDYAYPIPLFELVYRECVNLEPGSWGTLYFQHIVNHISMGRIPYLPYPRRDYLREGVRVEPTPGLPLEFWWVADYTEENVFLRGDRGWGEGLNWYDRLVKNVYEAACPLNEMTALVQMTGHEYLTEDRKVGKVSFGNGISIVVNRGEDDYELQGTLLPSQGFLADGPTFTAFYAARRDGIEYPGGALFTVRSFDGKPIAESRRMRVYHGFGAPEIRIANRVFRVDREAILDVAGS